MAGGQVPGLFHDLPHLGVGAAGVVVREQQAFGAGLFGQGYHFVIRGMAPALALRKISGSVLSIVNQQVAPGGKFHKFLQAATPARPQFIVRKEDHGVFALPKTEPQPALRMVEADGVNHRAVQFQRTVSQAIEVVDAGLELVEANRKKAVAHVAVENSSHGLEGRGPAVHQDFRIFMIDGSKKGDAEKMVPVAVGQEQVKPAGRITHLELFAQEAKAGAAVDHYPAVGGQDHFHTGGIAAELQGKGAGRRNRSPGAPKPDFHEINRASLKLRGLSDYLFEESNRGPRNNFNLLIFITKILPF